MTCPKCGKDNTVKKGNRNDKQRFQCKDCGVWFSDSKPIEINKKDIKDFNKIINEKDQEIDLLKRQIYYFNSNQKRHTVKFSKEKELNFGVIGDLHINSLYERNEMLSIFFTICEQENISTIFCTGDILDGHNIYRGQEYELYARGFKEQIDQFEKRMPKNDIKVYFITGNHDASFKKAIGISVGEEIEKRNSNWIFCGEDFANVDLITSNGSTYKVQMIHPSGGSAYSLSYKTQKIIESYSGGEKPNTVLVGHFHKSEHLPNYRNVQGIQSGTFQAQTPFMKSKALAAHLGGWIINISFNEERTINRFKTEFIAFYD